MLAAIVAAKVQLVGRSPESRHSLCPHLDTVREQLAGEVQTPRLPRRVDKPLRTRGVCTRNDKPTIVCVRNRQTILGTRADHEVVFQERRDDELVHRLSLLRYRATEPAPP